jgi:hypothetical protein
MKESSIKEKISLYISLGKRYPALMPCEVDMLRVLSGDPEIKKIVIMIKKLPENLK